MSGQWMGKPVRLKLRRTKGFNLQVESVLRNGRRAINCARPSPCGNRHLVGADLSAAEACARFKADIAERGGILHWKTGKLIPLADLREKLRGKNLACFCPLTAAHCHVDTLLEVANGN